MGCWTQEVAGLRQTSAPVRRNQPSNADTFILKESLYMRAFTHYLQ
jgi:hypothetical protein